MASFFSGRRISFAAVLESTRSHWVATHSDLPQSSLLCPLLCILYTAELQLSWHPVVLRQQLYADDIFRLSSNGLTSVRPQCSAPWRWWQWDVVQSTAPRRFQNRIYMAELFAATENVFSGHICWLSSHCLLDICLQFQIVPDHRPTFFEHLILFYRSPLSVSATADYSSFSPNAAQLTLDHAFVSRRIDYRSAIYIDLLLDVVVFKKRYARRASPASCFPAHLI